MDKTQKWQCFAALGGSALLYALWRWRKGQRDPFGFDTPVDRRGFKTVKYDLSPILFGEAARDCLQHWVADMDLPCCSQLRKKLAARMAHPIYGYTIQPECVWSAVGQWLVENQNWPKAPEPECFVFSGTVLASVGSILRTFAQPRDKELLVAYFRFCCFCSIPDPIVEELSYTPWTTHLLLSFSSFLSCKVLTMVPLYPPLQKVVTASGCILVQYDLPVKVEGGVSRYEMDVEAHRFKSGSDVVSLSVFQMSESVLRNRNLPFLMVKVRGWFLWVPNVCQALKKVLDKENVKFIILCSPHNPVGRVWTREELVALAGACRDRGILVIVDEVWADWCWKPFTPFHPVATDMGCKCISLGSPTKTWNLAGFHCSYAIFDDKAMLKSFKEYVQPQFLDHGSTFGTEALQIAYESKEWMYAVRDYVKANFTYLAECLKDIPGIKLVPCIAQICTVFGFLSSKLHQNQLT